RDVTGFEVRSESGPEVTVLNAENQGRVVFFQSGNEITFEGFTITGGRALSPDCDEGGGICGHLSSPVAVRSSIIASNSGGGAFSAELESALDLGCSDIYGNVGGDSLPPGTIDSGCNIFLDPQFCGVLGSQNYYLQSDSPCLTINHPGGLFCGLIGAYPARCGTVPVRNGSWGSIKRLNRDRWRRRIYY
ncbi:MAG: hypothetical protein KAX38_02205, partial [Candidatus Krumholzibacteria bacterium]|nr:hypothetical protein [Candidatus Krumholzibacteria bacterium]